MALGAQCNESTRSGCESWSQSVWVDPTGSKITFLFLIPDFYSKGFGATYVNVLSWFYRMIQQGIPILLMETRVNVFRVVILIFLRSNPLL